MATVIEKRVDTGGTGDYTSLSAWEAARQGNLVAADTIERAICEATTGVADVLQCVLSGWTTGPNNYIHIIGRHTIQPKDHSLQTPPVYEIRAALATTTGSIRMAFGGGAEYVLIEKICIKTRNNLGFAVQHQLSGTIGFLGVGHCVVTTTRTGTCDGSEGIRYRGITGSGCYVWNTLVFGFQNAAAVNKNYGIRMFASDLRGFIYNCTLDINDAGVSGESLVRVKNCFSGDSPDPFSSLGGFHASSDYNISDAGDAPGPNSKSGRPVFAGDISAAIDYHLDITDTVARRAGLDLSDDPTLMFSEDMEGTPRLMVWDVGADQVTQEDFLLPNAVRVLDGDRWNRWGGKGAGTGAGLGGGSGSGGDGGGGEIPGR